MEEEVEHLFCAFRLPPNGMESQQEPFQGKGSANPSPVIPGFPLSNCRPMEKADFNTEKVSSAEQEILSPSVLREFRKGSAESPLLSDRHTMTVIYPEISAQQ